MPLAVAVILQLAGVVGGTACLWIGVGPWAAGLLVAVVVFYLGLEGERG